MTDDMQKALETVGARQETEDTWLVEMPFGRTLKFFFPQDSEDLYAEIIVAEIAEDAPSELYRDLCEMNFFWQSTQGFSVALRGLAVVAQTRERAVRLAEPEALTNFIARADKAARAIYEVLTMPRETAEEGGAQ